MNHQVKKQLFDLTLSQRKDAFRMQQLISEHYRNYIIRVLEKAFDEASPADNALRIDKLEIDLGIINEREIENRRWEAIIFKKVTEQLALVLDNMTLFPGATIREKKESIAEQWLHYMQCGYLPFNVARPGSEWLLEVLRAFASDYSSITSLRALIHGSDVATERIVLQHNIPFLTALLETLCSSSQKTIPRIVDELTEIIEWQEQFKKENVEGGRRAISVMVWCTILKLAARGNSVIHEGKILHTLLEIYKIGNLDTAPIPRKFLSKKRKTAAALNEICKKRKINKRVDDGKTISNQEDIHAVANDRQQVHISPSPDTGNDKNILANRELAFDNSKTTHEWKPLSGNEESIYVKNAGLVLIHPFLPQFFFNLSLVENDQFVNPESHQKGLFLLHYLATGELDAEEHSLVTAKLLCGYPLHRPVRKEFQITETEKEECETLIKNIVGQWEILGSSTADGLRQGFFQREGKFTSEKGKHTLFLEPQAIDMLLDYLPWSISMIKLPWMNDILWIDWR